MELGKIGLVSYGSVGVRRGLPKLREKKAGDTNLKELAGIVLSLPNEFPKKRNVCEPSNVVRYGQC